MATIKYNGANITDTSRTDGIMTFSEVPNILEVQEDVSGDKAEIFIEVRDEFSTIVSAESQYYLTFFDETITNVLSPTQAVNKRFYVFPEAQGNAAVNTAMSIVKALRSCASLAADFIITTATTTDAGDSVLITAKTIGKRNCNQHWDTNIPQESVYVQIVNDGSSDSSSPSLAYNDGFFKSKNDIEVWEDDNYITTLEKTWYGDKCSFDVTPVLATLTEPTCILNEESVKKYNLKVSRLAENGAYTSLGEVSGLTTYGFEANASERYLPLYTQLLSNNFTSDKANIMYTYDYAIPYSVLCRAGTSPSGGFSVNSTVYDTAMNQLYAHTDFIRTPYGEPYIMDLTFEIPSYLHHTNAAYCDIEVMGDVIRYEIIKPLKASDGYQRVYWRNEYGGISHFDFTGQRSITDNLDIETYEKGIFGYYDVDSSGRYTSESKKIYSSNLKKTWTMKSHLLQQGGQYLFNSLMRSKMIWTTQDDKNVVLIPKSIEVTEDTTYNNIYTVTCKFEFSQENYG